MSNKEQVIQALRATLISVKGSLTLNQCNRDYRELQGEFIPYKKLGYSSLEKLFQGVPGFSIAQVNGEWFVDAIASQETQHIASMVARQKSNKKRPGKFNYEVMARGAGRGRVLPGRGGIWRRPFIRPRVSTLRPPFDLILAEPAFPRCKPAPDDSALTQVMARGAGRGSVVPGRGGIWRRPFIRPRVSTLRPPFDLILAEPAFPRCKPAPDDSALTQALLKRHAELCPTPVEQWAVLNLVNKLQTVLDDLVVAPGDFTACQLEEVRQVGSYKKGTMMTGKNVADIVVIMKTLPTKESIEGLSNKVNEELNKLMRAEGLANVTSACHERGFTVSASAAAVRVLVTTLHQNLRRLEPEVHLEYKVINSHLAAIRHSRWFEENAHHSSIKVLIRLLRDMCARHSGLEPLTPWMIDLLAHHCIMNNPARQALPINVAFRRALSLLASGLFLPGCSGLPDPCEAAHASVHTALDLTVQEHAAATAQTLLRIVARGGHRYVLGLQPFEGGKDISTEITVWDGVVVSPLAPAYQETPEPMDVDDKDEGA